MSNFEINVLRSAAVKSAKNPIVFLILNAYDGEMTTKANAFYFFIFFLIFISGFSAHSKDRKVSSYFYTTLQTGTDSGEWAFKIPKCAQLSAKIYHLIKSNCESHGDYQFCRSKEMAQAENTMTGAKQKFAKAYLIFESKEICEKDRLKYLNEDES